MTDEQTVNIPLLRKAVEWAEAEAAKPDIRTRQWMQDDWVSEPMDVAWELAVQEMPRATFDDITARAKKLAPECGTAYCIAGYIGQMLDVRYANTERVEGVHVSRFAAEALGIDSNHGLFEADNSIEDVRRIAEEIAGERL